MIEIAQELEKYGLSQNQADIYLLLVRQGNLRISEIVRTLQIPRSSVYENLKELSSIGLTEITVENNFKRVKAHPVSALSHGLQEKIVELKQQTVELKHLEKALSQMPSSMLQQPITVRYYQGRSGARQLYWNSLKAQGEIYVISSYGRSKFVGKKYYMDFVQESYARKIEKKLSLTPPTMPLASLNGILAHH